MFTSTVVLAGTVVIEGVAFRWSVTEGWTQRLTVGHDKLGMRSEPLAGSPESQARVIGRAILARAVRIPEVDVVDDFGPTLCEPATEQKR
jgi:hypothetical protein